LCHRLFDQYGIGDGFAIKVTIAHEDLERRFNQIVMSPRRRYASLYSVQLAGMAPNFQFIQQRR
jgi:hypothetical protein